MREREYEKRDKLDRQTEREREREREREKPRQTDRQKEKESERDREREIEKERERKRERGGHVTASFLYMHASKHSPTPQYVCMLKPCATRKMCLLSVCN